MEAVNPQIQDMVMNKKLSPRKIRNLIVVKKMIDRLALRPHLAAEDVERLEAKYGVKPDVITWGDYFQTEIATDHWEKTDTEFEAIIQTITFDIIASILIFDGKPEEFCEQIKLDAIESQDKHRSEWTLQDEENVHLVILLEYFQQMGLNMKALTDQDFAYFEHFATEKKVS